MTALESRLIERLKKLPASRVAEVVDFVEFLAAREERAAAATRLGDTFARIDAQGLPPMSDDEIEAEIQADPPLPSPRRLSGHAAPMRFVIDTNLIVSGIISAGVPRQLLNAARAGEFELCTSEALLSELQRVLGRAKFANRLANQTPERIVGDLRLLAIVVAPTSVPRVVPTDPDDDQVLAAALAGGADLIASGDRHDLLPLLRYEGIPIVSAREALDRLESLR